MLDTKRRIDTARDILVGKVPDPKSQVEQITIALIYKFMDDMDADAEEMGGKRKFFAGEYARYGWSKLMQPGLGGHEMLNLYAEGIGKMPQNPGIPPLFRDIFKNAFLPYRDPETLTRDRFVGRTDRGDPPFGRLVPIPAEDRPRHQRRRNAQRHERHRRISRAWRQRHAL